MTLVTFVLIALLWFFGHRAGHSSLAPHQVLSATWAVSIFALLVTGRHLYPVSTEACAIYLIGTYSFAAGSIGALTALPLPRPVAPPRLSSLANRVLTLLLMVVILGLPFYWGALVGSAAHVEGDVLLHSIRVAQIERSDQATSFGFVQNLALLAQFIAVVIFIEARGPIARRWRVWVAVAVAFVYGAMGGSKASAVTLLLTLFFASSLRVRHLRVRRAVLILVVALAIFCLGLLAINFAYTDFSGLSAALDGVVDTVQTYWLGGIIAFSRIADSPDAITLTQPVHRFFLDTARSLGLSVEVPPRHADYTAISPVADTNVYTIYFSYFTSLGLGGTALIMCAIGVFLALLFRRSMTSRPIPTLLLSQLSVGLILSIHAEHFLQELNGILKFVFFLLFIYRVIPILERTPMRLRHA